MAGESESSPEVKRGEYWANIVERRFAYAKEELADMSPEIEGGEVG